MSKKIVRLSLVNLILLLSIKFTIAEPLNVGSFNINSGRATFAQIARQISEHKDIDIWGLSESSNAWASKLLSELRTKRNFSIIKGTTGIDRNFLQIAYDQNKYHLISHMELDEINIDSKVRAPLVGKFQNNKTGHIFFFMVNHLYRKDSDARHTQARLINKWIEKQNLPVVAVGDYNFDMSPENTDKRGQGFDEITKDEILQWVKPGVLVPSQCSKYRSILDFVFISNKVKYISAESSIQYPETDYCNDKRNSDHRPLTASIDIA